jgi:hypothetical protein
LHEFKEDVFDAGDDFYDSYTGEAGMFKGSNHLLRSCAFGECDVDGVTEGLRAQGMLAIRRMAERQSLKA